MLYAMLHACPDGIELNLFSVVMVHIGRVVHEGPWAWWDPAVAPELFFFS